MTVNRTRNGSERRESEQSESTATHALSRRECIVFLAGSTAAVLSGCGPPPVYARDESSTEIVYASTRSLAEAIRRRRLSSREVVDAYLERIEQVNPALNAVVLLDPEGALAAARRADDMLARGGAMGPLHGVPVTIKDSLDTAGMLSTAGTAGRAAYVPTQDATVVARLRAAGAIVIGKTNTPELTLSFETDNTIYGRTSNPYDPKRTSGGSSGGAAAIIAAGGSPLDIGSDTGGSIRVPSHCCGIAGIKPTSGRVPRTGHIISAEGLHESLTQLGPMARYVEDLILVLPIISGPDWRDPHVVGMPLGDPDAVNLGSLRIAFYTNNGISTPTPEVAQVVRNAADAVASAGATVQEDLPPGLQEAAQAILSLWYADGGAWVRRLLETAGTTQPGQRLAASFVDAAPLTAEELTRLVEQQDRIRGTMLSFLERYDAVICPVNADPALPHGEAADPESLPKFSYTYTYNVAGWPGAVVRGGTSPEGLPIGVQVLARPWREDVALAVARHLESALGGWEAPNI